MLRIVTFVATWDLPQQTNQIDSKGIHFQQQDLMVGREPWRRIMDSKNIHQVSLTQ
jgi:hypothetical protein